MRIDQGRTKSTSRKMMIRRKAHEIICIRRIVFDVLYHLSADVTVAFSSSLNYHNFYLMYNMINLLLLQNQARNVIYK